MDFEDAQDKLGGGAVGLGGRSEDLTPLQGATNDASHEINPPGRVVGNIKFDAGTAIHHRRELFCVIVNALSRLAAVKTFLGSRDEKVLDEVQRECAVRMVENNMIDGVILPDRFPLARCRDEIDGSPRDVGFGRSRGAVQKLLPLALDLTCTPVPGLVLSQAVHCCAKSTLVAHFGKGMCKNGSPKDEFMLCLGGEKGKSQGFEANRQAGLALLLFEFGKGSREDGSPKEIRNSLMHFFEANGHAVVALRASELGRGEEEVGLTTGIQSFEMNRHIVAALRVPNLKREEMEAWLTEGWVHALNTVLTLFPYGFGRGGEATNQRYPVQKPAWLTGDTFNRE
ncbi:hypothetical protein BKA70DRAFT_1409722 [Coprinopsis sp. MPI-PUGE-AT-0042]|nr:hypothetical protein BKA70DRAFT_1409722 [Coprinopsis sp. MPI-PUGE-AT-0042]